MMGRHVHYYDYIDDPEFVAMCMECEAPDCAGICDRFKNRVNRLCGVPEVHTPPPKPPKPPRPPKRKLVRHVEKNGELLEAFGEKHTLSEWSRIKGIRYHTLYMRIRRGKTMEEALSMDLEYICPVPATITAGGETLTVKEWARRLCVSRDCIYQRIMRGMSPESAVTTGRRPPSYKRGDDELDRHALDMMGRN